MSCRFGIACLSIESPPIFPNHLFSPLQSFLDHLSLTAWDLASSPQQTAGIEGRFAAFEWTLPLEFLQSAGLFKSIGGGGTGCPSVPITESFLLINLRYCKVLENNYYGWFFEDCLIVTHWTCSIYYLIIPNELVCTRLIAFNIKLGPIVICTAFC